MVHMCKSYSTFIFIGRTRFGELRRMVAKKPFTVKLNKHKLSNINLFLLRNNELENLTQMKTVSLLLLFFSEITREYLFVFKTKNKDLIYAIVTHI